MVTSWLPVWAPPHYPETPCASWFQPYDGGEWGVAEIFSFSTECKRKAVFFWCSYKPWEVQENLWKEKCKWSNCQNKAFLVSRMAQLTGKSVVETLRELDLAEQSGMLRTNADGSVEIK